MGQAAYSRLTEAMRVCCERHGGATTLERWLAEGFWFVGTFVRPVSEDPNFPRPGEPAYYQRAYERLWALADWFFRGHSPHEPGQGFEPL